MITYGLLSIRRTAPSPRVIAKGEPFDMTILDEAAAVKNSGANRTKAILGKMLPKLGYLLPLSRHARAQPRRRTLPHPQGAAPQGAAHRATGTVMDQWQFEDTFCKVVRKRFGNGPDVRVIEGSKNLPELKRRLDGFMVRVRKEDVLKDLPPIRYDIVPLQVSDHRPASIDAGGPLRRRPAEVPLRLDRRGAHHENPQHSGSGQGRAGHRVHR